MRRQETKKRRRLWLMLIFALCCLMFVQVALAEEPENGEAVNEDVVNEDTGNNGELNEDLENSDIVNEGVESGNTENSDGNEEKEIVDWYYVYQYNEADQTGSWGKYVLYSGMANETIPLEGKPEFAATDVVRIDLQNWEDDGSAVPVTIQGDLPIVDVMAYSVVIIDGSVGELRANVSGGGSCTVTGNVEKLWVYRHGGDIWIQGTLGGGEEWDYDWNLHFDI